MFPNVADIWRRFQGELFPELATEIGPLGPTHERLVAVLSLSPPEAFLGGPRGSRGRPQQDRAALARAFVAKAVWDFPTTRVLIDRLLADRPLRRLCGWQRVGEVPSEATFSRAFAEFAASGLPALLHESLVRAAYGDWLVFHLSRDSTAIEAREKPAPKKTKEPKHKRKRGRPRKGEEPQKEPSRIELQLGMGRDEMLADLPKVCDVGTKRNAKGHQTSWIGYKLHIDSDDVGVPLSCLLTSASLHDCQAAIPLSVVSEDRCDYLYELMDSAYDAQELKDRSIAAGHVPIIDVNPRRSKKLKEAKAAEPKARRAAGHVDPKVGRYRKRSTVERVNGRLKDEFGGRHVRVRGHAKVYCHLMFGILSLAADQLLRFRA